MPIRPTLDWAQAKASPSRRRFPGRDVSDRFTATLSKARRKGKIFIDYLRNAEGATAIRAVRRPRSRANAPVATPIAWEELRDDVRFDHFNVRNVPERLGETQMRSVARFLRSRADRYGGDGEARQQAVNHCLSASLSYGTCGDAPTRLPRTPGANRCRTDLIGAEGVQQDEDRNCSTQIAVAIEHRKWGRRRSAIISRPRRARSSVSHDRCGCLLASRAARIPERIA